MCAFGALIKEPLLSDYWMLNVHPSLLPRWRGAAPIERAIMAGDERTGVSIMRLTAGLDSGPVLRPGAPSRSVPIDTYGSLAARLQDLGGELLVGVLDDRPDCSRAGRSARHLRGEDRAARTASSTRAGPPTSSSASSGR